MGLVRGLLRLLESAFGDKDVPPTNDAERSSDKQDCEAQSDYEGQEQRSSGSSQRGYKIGQGKLGRYFGLFHVFNNAELRHRLALRGAVGWAASLVTVGVVLTVLCATGTFPASVDDMEAVGIFGEYLSKYILYIVGGLVTMAGVVLVYSEIKRDSSTTPGELVLYLALAIDLTTIGLTGYLISKDAELHVKWWNYLIQAVILVQRICVTLAIIAALWAVRDSHKSKAARQAIIEARY